MSKKNTHNRGTKNIKEMFATHYDGMREYVEELFADEAAQLREEFATKSDLESRLVMVCRKLMADVERLVMQAVEKKWSEIDRSR